MRRVASAAVVLGAAALAVASVGNGSVVATQPVVVIAGSAGSATLDNTTSSTFQVDLAQDVSCAPDLGFSVAGGHPFSLAGSASKSIQLTCPGDAPGIKRCLVHALDTTDDAALADFLQVCMTGSSATLTTASSIDFGSAVMVGSVAAQSPVIHNAGSATISELFLQTTDLDGDFGFALPCTRPGPFCDATIAPLAPGGDASISIACTPRTPGLHTASLYVATDTGQVLAQPVALRCNAVAATTPVLAIDPASIEVASPVEVTGGSASAVIHVTNAGSGTLIVNDVRAVDVDAGAAADWSYTASGHCTGQIAPACQLGPGDIVDLHVTFDPSQIATRNASLLVSYHDTANRSTAIPLDGKGGGATLQVVGNQTSIDLGVVPVAHASSIDFFLANHGTRDTDADLSLMPGGAPFSLMPGSQVTVSPGTHAKVTATCAPIAAGPFTTTITADSADAFASSQLSIIATCVGSTDALYAMPSTLAFGEIRAMSAPVTRTVQLLSASGPQVTLDGPPSLETSTTGISIGPLSSMTTPATFDVTIDPSVDGNLTNHIFVASDGNTLKIPVSGRVAAASYTVPQALDIGTFCINQPTTSSNLSLMSTGGATFELAPPTLGSGVSFELSLTAPSSYPAEVLPGQSAIVAITPKPQQAATSVSDTIRWATDVADAPQRTTDVTARFIDSGGAIAPPVLDFGKVLVHITEDNGQRVVLQNCNGSVLMLDPPTIKAPFSIDSPTVPSLLQPNETATFSIGFHPTRLGTFTGTLQISSQQLTTSLSVSLVGEGIGGDPGIPDAGSDAGPHDDGGCGCHTTDVGGTAPPLFVVLLVVFRRRRIRYSGDR
jgi:MYXO-CTERM domain-containing protein